LPLLAPSNAYNMVLHKHGPRLYEGLTRTLTAHLTDVAGKLEGKEGAAFLRELKKRWDDHNKSTQMIRDILMVRWPYPSKFAGLTGPAGRFREPVGRR
jgi:hypothetical protein